MAASFASSAFSFLSRKKNPQAQSASTQKGNSPSQNIAGATNSSLVNHRADFPILSSALTSNLSDSPASSVSRKSLIYLDSACVSLRPQQVIDVINSYYITYSSCAGRSNHRLSRELDMAIRTARDEVSQFIGAKHPDEIIFTKNASEAINLVANALTFEPGDIILTSHKEHNSNLVPWLSLVARTKSTNNIVHKIIHPDSDGSFSAENLQKELDAAKKSGQRVRLVSVHHVSNVDGTQLNIADIVKRSHWYGALVLVDGCQAAGHMPINVRELGADFYAFSAHKMCGPSGMGALYVSRAAQEQLGEFIVGGQTVVRTTYTSYTPLEGPAKFEAGLQDYAGILGFAAACKYLRKIGLEAISNRVQSLNTMLTDLLAAEIDNKTIELLGPRDAKDRGSIFSFVVKSMPQTEFAALLDKTYGIAVRAGQHCVHSWFNATKREGSVRISLHFYNTADEISETAQVIRALLRLHNGGNNGGGD